VTEITPPPRASAEYPFVGLTNYTENDAEFFFGRDDERQIIVGNLRASRLTLLYAASGAGKSSVLRAGVMPRLRTLAERDRARTEAAGYIPIVFSAWSGAQLSSVGHEPPETQGGEQSPANAAGGDVVSDLIAEIQREVNNYRPGADMLQLPRHRLDEAVEVAARDVEATLLIVLDQFEEFFLYSAKEAHPDNLAIELARCINSTDLPVHFLIAIREDAYSQLGNLFTGRVANLYGNYLHLERLTRAQARQAIAMPIERFNEIHPDLPRMSAEPELIEAVLDQVRAGEVTLAQGGAGSVDRTNVNANDDAIETPYLQLVMMKLWESETSEGSQLLRLSTLERLGGAQTIVRTHLDNTLEGFSAKERQVLADVFHHLVTPSGTKIVHAVADLADYSGHPVAEVDQLLHKLEQGDTRIVRRVDPPAGQRESSPRYEIFHDVLVSAILDWRSRFQQRKAVQRARAILIRRIIVAGVIVAILAAAGIVVAVRHFSRASTINGESVVAVQHLQSLIPVEFDRGCKTHTVDFGKNGETAEVECDGYGGAPPIGTLYFNLFSSTKQMTAAFEKIIGKKSSAACNKFTTFSVGCIATYGETKPPFGRMAEETEQSGKSVIPNMVFTVRKDNVLIGMFGSDDTKSEIQADGDNLLRFFNDTAIGTANGFVANGEFVAKGKQS